MCFVYSTMGRTPFGFCEYHVKGWKSKVGPRSGLVEDFIDSVVGSGCSTDVNKRVTLVWIG